MKSLGIAPAFHHAAREFVDDDDLIVLDDVVPVALEHDVRAERLVHMMDQGHVVQVIEGPLNQLAGAAEKFFDVFVTRVRKGYGLGFFVLFIVVIIQSRDDLVDGGVGVR